MSGNSQSNSTDLGVPSLHGTLRGFLQDIWLGMKHRPFRTISILGAVVAAVITLGIGLKRFATSHDLSGPVTEMLLERSLQELDAGNISLARQIAAELRLHEVPEDKRGIPPYVLGMAMRHDALTGDWQPGERKSLHLLAARYLDEARQAGFPSGRDSEALLVLAQSLRDCGRHAEALPHLHALHALPSAATSEVQRLLADCYLHDEPPDLEKASGFNQQYLAQPGLPAEDRRDALLTQAHILFQLEKLTECQQVLDQLSESSGIHGETLLLAARLKLHEGEAFQAAGKDDSPEAAARFAEAQKLLEQAASERLRGDAAQRQRQYLLGLVYRRLGQLDRAEEQFARTARAYLGSPEGIAAGLEQAELQRLRGDDSAALESYRRTFRHAAEFNNQGGPWLAPGELRRRAEEAIDTHLRNNRFAQAADLAEALNPLFPDSRALLLRIAIHRRWAERLARDAAENSTDVPALLAQSRAQRRRTGQLLEQLARLRFATREYAQSVWESAETYRDGQDYYAAARMYQRYLQLESGATRPAALVQLGQVDLARNDPGAALNWLDECIQFYPASPFLYRARVLAAQARLELGETAAAMELLTANLENGSLTPASQEWCDSLFLMGRTLFEQGMRHEAQSRLLGVDSTLASEREAGLAELRLAADSFASCIRQLSEAVQRQPDSPHAILSRYMVAQARLQSAKLPKKELLTAVIETTRVALRNELQRHLTEAAAAFEQLKLLLVERQEKVPLTPVENRILRNCYFARADALFDLQQYEDAIQAYSSATHRYQHEPESLEAYVQIANCYRKLDQPLESHRTLESARLILNRIRPDADFLAVTRYDRQEWNDLLTWMTTL